MPHHLCRKTAAALALLLTLGVAPLVRAQNNSAATTNAGGKEVLIPSTGIDTVPEGNDFNDTNSMYSWARSKSTDNFVLFWAKEYGDNPSTNTGNRHFDVDAILKEADRFYNFYVDDMKFVDKTNSYATKYKFLFFVFSSSRGGTAFGGSVDNKIGAFWTPASRINRGPYGVVAHELGHSFQALTQADVHAPHFSGGGAINEMTSQWMLWQVYDWLTVENYHLKAWMAATQLAFMHEDNQYHTAGILEYWSEKHGLEIMGKVWRGVQRGEDPVMTYKRITGINQDQFNDEIFDASRRFVTWDLKRIEKQSAPYANQHFTSIFATNDWYQIGWTNAPQNYGYNAIQLKVPATPATISLDFQGLEGADGYKSVHPEWAGWRYGFLASKEDGSRVYSDTFSKSTNTVQFAVPANTKFLWLVVSGAPTEHWIHVAGGGGRRGGNTGGGASNAGEQWPYMFKVTGTTPVDSIIHLPSQLMPRAPVQRTPARAPATNTPAGG